MIKTVIATVDGVRVQGKAALCEVDAAFKKLHEELDQRKAKVIEEVKNATSQRKKSYSFRRMILSLLWLGYVMCWKWVR